MTRDTAKIRAGWDDDDDDDDDDGGGGGGNRISCRDSFSRIFQPFPVAHLPGQARGKSMTWRNHESANTASAICEGAHRREDQYFSSEAWVAM